MSGKPGPEKERIAPDAAPWGALRAQVLAALGRGEPRTVLIAPIAETDDGAAVASGLAASLAAAGIRVVLVDTDFHRPRLHSLFGKEQAPGLADFLRKGVAASHLPLQAVNAVLQLLPAGRDEGLSADLLAGPDLERLLADLKNQRNWVVALSAALDHGSQPAALAPLADGTILVGADGVTRRKKAVEGQRILRSVGARLLGAVMLKVH